MDTTNLKTLNEIAIEEQTDRATVFTRTWAKPHGYAPHYDRILSPLRHLPIKMLEIGAAGGEGIKMWLRYFDNPEARIYGVDIVQNTNPWNTPGNHDRYTFNQGDQSSETFWACWIADHGSDWDFICDDGSHNNKDIIMTFNALWPVLSKGGFYAIEDLGVDYPASESSIFFTPGYPHHMQWISRHIDILNVGDGSVDSIYLSKELCILKKSL